MPHPPRSLLGAHRPTRHLGATQEPAAVTTWRPTTQSFSSLAAFFVGLAVSSAAVLVWTRSAMLVAVTGALALVAGSVLSVVFTRRKVLAALETAEQPVLRNWPGSPEDRRALRHRGRVRARRSTAMALVLGGLGGFYPAVGVAFVGAGVAGALTSGAVAFVVHGYEGRHRVTVMTPVEPRARRRLRFGIAPGPA